MTAPRWFRIVLWPVIWVAIGWYRVWGISAEEARLEVSSWLASVSPKAVRNWCLVAVGLTLLVSCQTPFAIHDRITRQAVLAVVARELPIGATLDDMKAFLERHTTRFSLDDKFNHVYGGFLPQTRWDRFLFDRQVQVNLYLDDRHRFSKAEVDVGYTFL